MIALFKLIPLKDWLYVAAILTVIVGLTSYTVHERRVGAAHEVAALKASSDKLNAAADAKIAALTKEHAATVAQVESKLDAQLQSALTQHDADLKRLRDFDAYRRVGCIETKLPS